MQRSSIRPGRPALAGRVGLLFLIALAAGCAPAKVKVTGRVLYDGAPLPGGRLTFRPADAAQNSISAVIDPEGKYEAVLPAGEVQVCVDNRELAPPDPPTGGPPLADLPADVRSKIANAGATPEQPAAPGKAKPLLPGAYKAIPARYYEVETSGLHFAVASGQDKHDVELTK